MPDSSNAVVCLPRLRFGPAFLSSIVLFVVLLLAFVQIGSCTANKTELTVLWLYAAPISGLANAFALDRSRLRLDSDFDLEGTSSHCLVGVL